MHPILASEPNQIIGAGSILMLGLACFIVVKIKQAGGARALCLLLLVIGLAVAVAGTWNVWRPFGTPLNFAETELCMHSKTFCRWDQQRHRAAFLADMKSGKIKPLRTLAIVYSPALNKFVSTTNEPQFRMFCFLYHPFLP